MFDAPIVTTSTAEQGLSVEVQDFVNDDNNSHTDFTSINNSLIQELRGLTRDPDGASDKALTVHCFPLLEAPNVKQISEYSKVEQSKNTSLSEKNIVAVSDQSKDEGTRPHLMPNLSQASNIQPKRFDREGDLRMKSLRKTLGLTFKLNLVPEEKNLLR